MSSLALSLTCVLAPLHVCLIYPSPSPLAPQFPPSWAFTPSPSFALSPPRGRILSSLASSFRCHSSSLPSSLCVPSRLIYPSLYLSGILVHLSSQR
ncbi:hypothetical protein DFH09DRAFT_1170204 [Mycena vulgaris]|nr:hypothetical protein DFH09DRAFT_1233547 [Mycena vulgaris]KAJ6547942.1 hypothetical protein DFH09DRAFT_1170204 [Mycena vulgaris]